MTFWLAAFLRVAAGLMVVAVIVYRVALTPRFVSGVLKESKEFTDPASKAMGIAFAFVVTCVAIFATVWTLKKLWAVCDWIVCGGERPAELSAVAQCFGLYLIARAAKAPLLAGLGGPSQKPRGWS